MPLPFGKHDGKRQFACFVCGVLQPDKASFIEHITKTHEEGREYVVCPMSHCKMPVRDLRAHFKAIHPHYTCPKDQQMKALIWKDAKDPTKRKKKVSFEEGYFSSAKNRKKLHYNSGWEKQVYEVLEGFNDVVRYEVEPLTIEYWFDGEQHHYLPDLKVHYSDGRKEIWEIKPMNQTNLAVNEAKWESCSIYCEKRDWKFRVVTEVGIGRLKKGIPLD